MRALWGTSVLRKTVGANFLLSGVHPLFDRFFLGGEDSIRGYNIRSISPLVPLRNTFSTQNVFVTDENGKKLKVRPGNQATANSVTPQVINDFTVQNATVPPLFAGAPENLIPVGGDTQVLLNFEYRIPIVGPLAFAPFFDIGSVFNLRKSSNQFIISEFVPTQLNNSIPIILNQRGNIATERQLRQARTPESPGTVPPGFRIGGVFGDRQD